MSAAAVAPAPNSFSVADNVVLHIGDAVKLVPKLDINGKVDLIYLDPPYETQRDYTLTSKLASTGFSDVWEKDAYEIWLGSLIDVLKSTLSPQGSLVLHISAENSFIAEKCLQERFKKIDKIFWVRCHGKNTVCKKLGAVVDIIFVAWNGNRIFNMQYVPLPEDSKWAFKNQDERGHYSLGALKHDRTRKGHDYEIVRDGVAFVAPYGWKLPKSNVEQLIADNRIHFVPKSKNMYVKIYKHEHRGKPLSNLWDDVHSITRTTSDPRLYPTQKPQKLLERIILLFSNENSLVLDPVCGSGTTGFVAQRLRRRSVMVDQNPEVESIIKERFKKAVYSICSPSPSATPTMSTT